MCLTFVLSLLFDPYPIHPIRNKDTLSAKGRVTK